MAEGGFLRWLQNLDVGGPAHFAEILNEEYRLNGYGTSFAALDEECRRQQEAQRTLMFAMAAAPAIDSLVYGPTGVVYGNNAFDNLERQGTTLNFTGNQFSWKPKEAAREYLQNANYAQKTYSFNFSKKGQQIFSELTGKPI